MAAIVLTLGGLPPAEANATSTEPPTATAALDAVPATAIAAGYGHTCAVLANRTVWCWGWNRYGQLGDGTTTDSLTPVAVRGISNATAVAAGEGHTCALLTDGGVMCWGWNPSGQLGDGTTSDSLTPVAVSGISNATAIALGAWHSCAVLANGVVACWGSNLYGNLGDGTETTRLTPVTASGITTATAISAGVVHTCAVLGEGTAMCWGAGSWGRLGDGTETHQRTPVAVSGITTATTIAAGFLHSCAVLADGTAMCWGNNGFNQLGDGTQEDSLTPVVVSGIITSTEVETGDSWHSCGIIVNGAVACWGLNTEGQLGDGTTDSRLTPVAVSGIFTATAVVVGGYHSCVLLDDGAVMCWGLNLYGQLGDGTTIDRWTPVLVVGLGGGSDRKLIFVPGIMSNLDCDSDRVSDPKWQALWEHLQANVGYSPDSLFVFSYSDRYDCPEAPAPLSRGDYGQLDTCSSNIVHANNFGRWFRQLTEIHPTSQFDIVAHSMGGVVVMYWAAAVATLLDRDEGEVPLQLERVGGIVTLDSPLRGRPMAGWINRTLRQLTKPVDAPGSGLGDLTKTCQEALKSLDPNSSVIKTINDPVKPADCNKDGVDKKYPDAVSSVATAVKLLTVRNDADQVVPETRACLPGADDILIDEVCGWPNHDCVFSDSRILSRVISHLGR